MWREKAPLCVRSSMDRASDSGSESWGFESLRACQKRWLVFLPTISFAFLSALCSKQPSRFACLFEKGPAMVKCATGTFHFIAASGVPKQPSPIRVSAVLFRCAQRDSNPERVSGTNKTVRWTVFSREVRSSCIPSGAPKEMLGVLTGHLFCLCYTQNEQPPPKMGGGCLIINSSVCKFV